MKEDEAVEAALQTAPRNEDGSIDEKALIDEVAELLDFDEQQERRNKASRAVKRRRTPGQSQPDGVVALPGMEPYQYEPDRLVADNEGRVIEQSRCRPNHKRAEAERARETARRQSIWANRKTEESEAFASWAIEQLSNGRPARDLTFGAFVIESGHWQQGIGYVEPGPVTEEAE